MAMKTIIKQLLREGFIKHLQDDIFVHFTTGEYASQIMGSRILGKGEFTTFAVSIKWGIYNGGAVLPKKGGVAILFKTNKLPTYGYVEEVTWAGPIPLTMAKIIPVEDAIAMLQRSEAKTPVGEMDRVNYINESIENHDFEYKGYTCKIPYIAHRKAYGCQVYKGDKYVAAIKGWLPLDKAIEHAKMLVDGQIKKPSLDGL